MPNELILFVYYIMWYFLIALTFMFIISGLDDFFIDLYFWIRYIFRLWKTRHYEPLTYQKMAEKEEQLIAILVPCWHEAGVIGTMLRHNCYSIDYTNYYIFVGVYPNDPTTIDEVKEVAREIMHVQCVIGETPGPTNKAANLNSIYLYTKKFEQTINKKFDIFVFHDSEDIIHPLSFKLYNYLCPKKDMIQIPIFPLKVNLWNFTHWMYADEFSENHTKDIIVRESIGGHVPSAGVGTAFSRKTLQLLENPKTRVPFSTESLTEDYHTSLEIRLKKLKSIFAAQKVTYKKWQPRGIFRSGYIQKPIQEYIATRALFPMEYTKAVRQKTRWIIGIIFQEWKHEWPHAWSVRFTLAHDRKAFLTHFVNGFGYVVLIFWILYSLFTLENPEYPSLQEQFNLHPWVWAFIIGATFLMFERALQRIIAIRRIYGWAPAFLSIPRYFYNNLINFHAIVRAYIIYNSTPKTNKSAKQPTWDKTDHHFPGSHILTPHHLKLGRLLISAGLINQPQLDQAIIEQKKTGELLGETLCRMKIINRRQLMVILADQFKLKLFSQSKVENAKNSCNLLLPKKIKQFVTKNNLSVIAINEAKSELTISLDDPTNEYLIEQIINRVSPYTVTFVLTDPDS
ncbi:glycosyltransferase [Legionella sainthelensi]|uniref:glycosyltransferase n=1 Tax=Legionella sainthelensi TaxID=28087 RepID=UPI000E206686|nr:glycosyltransferase [Legionella sainthelensi]